MKQEPYYKADGITIYHGDCREVLPIGASVTVTDPPYGISDTPIQGQGRTGKRVGRVNTWHPESIWDEKIDPEWCRLVCVATPIVAWFGHWRKRFEVECAMTYPIRAEIVWAKNCHVGPPCPLAYRDERIWLFSASGIEPKSFETTVWDVPIIPTWEKKWHKNEKPLDLMQRLLIFLGGEAVLDPFMGSGTTLVAARNLGRKAIGIEIDERYCEIAARRLDQTVMDLGA